MDHLQSLSILERQRVCRVTRDQEVEDSLVRRVPRLQHLVDVLDAEQQEMSVVLSTSFRFSITGLRAWVGCGRKGEVSPGRRIEARVQAGDLELRQSC